MAILLTPNASPYRLTRLAPIILLANLLGSCASHSGSAASDSGATGRADSGSTDATVDTLSPGAGAGDGLGPDAASTPAIDARPSDASTVDATGGADTPAVDAVAPAGDAADDAVVPRDATLAPDGTIPRDGAASDAGPTTPFRILLFSRTTGFRHVSIPTALAALQSLQTTGGYVAEATEDPTVFTAANLARFQVVVFALTSGDVLNATQKAVFEAWLASGGGYVGIHSASDTEHNWPFYGTLVGAYFRSHPAQQTATVRVEAPTHPIMAGVPVTWSRRDEWYDFNINPRPNVTVLATLDESTYTGGTMGADHPIIWAHVTAGGGRSFYTALGHTPESYAEAPFRRHLVNGIRWAAKR